MPLKRKVSVSLDADLIDELAQAEQGGLSSQINQAVRSEVERRRRFEALRLLLDELDRTNGPLGEKDEPEIERFVRALGGT